LVAFAIDWPSESYRRRAARRDGDRALELVNALLDREVLDDPLPDLLEAVVVGVEFSPRQPSLC
jgi:hypothetical protein